MTQRRKKQGATLALVISLVFVFLLIGACFFVWQLLIGGGKELQHATDSGNLNVAKQSLKTPDVLVPDSIDPNTGTNLRAEFQDVLTDPSNPGSNYKVNLLNFNRLVGKAILAQLNAKAEGTDKARNNAAQLTRAVYNIGQQLQSRLESVSSLKGQFEGISNQNSVRMLDHPQNGSNGSSVAHTDAEWAVSYVARGKASNIYIDPNEIPPGVSFSPSDLVTKDVGGSKQFIAGYKSLTSAAGLSGVPETWTVPLRPGEQPHLIGVDDFDSGKQAPFSPFTIANSFKSGGQAQFARTAADVKLRSCAVVGVLDKTFPLQSSGGTIIVDNSGTNVQSATINDSGSSIYADPTKMMNPAGVEIFSVTAVQGSFPGGGSTRQFMIHSTDGSFPSDQIKAHAQSTDNSSVGGSSPDDEARTYPDNNIPQNIDFWAMKMHNQGRYYSQYHDRNLVMGNGGGGTPGQSLGGIATRIQHVAFCNNMSFDGGGGGANPPECGNTPAFVALCNGQIGVPSGGTGTTTYTDLMPLEQYILAIKGGFGGGSGCVMVPALGPIGSCALTVAGSGMKHIVGQPPFPLGTLDELLGDTSNPPTTSQIRNDMAARMRQIAPNQSPESIFAQTVPYNTIVYIRNSNGNIVMDSTKPGSLQYDYESQSPLQRPIVSAPKNIPDGDLVLGNNNIGVSGNWVPGFMWECGNGMASGRSAALVKWYPSSGKGGLLGVLKFNNCAEANGDDWCCP